MADKSAHKERTRARILDEAARALRASGTQGVSVAELMKRAGLTHGGFYAHFASRDDLVANAIERMFEDSQRMLDRYLLKNPNAEGLSALIDYYLSPKAMRAVDRGCPIPALTSEAVRMPEAARARFERGVHVFRAAIREALAAMDRPAPAREAASVLSEMAGAIALARSISDPCAAEEYLDASRQSLRARLGLDTPAN